MQNWSKFCVARQALRFAKDDQLRFFQIGEIKGENLPEIIYLGKNKAPNTTEIYNQVAADTWGFAVLRLAEFFPKKEILPK